MNRHFGLVLGLYARVYGSTRDGPSGPLLEIKRTRTYNNYHQVEGTHRKAMPVAKTRVEYR